MLLGNQNNNNEANGGNNNQNNDNPKPDTVQILHSSTALEYASPYERSLFDEQTRWTNGQHGYGLDAVAYATDATPTRYASHVKANTQNKENTENVLSTEQPRFWK